MNKVRTVSALLCTLVWLSWVGNAAADGFAITCQSFATPRDYTQAAEVVKEHLKPLKIDMTVQPLEPGTFATNNGMGNFDMQLTGRGFRHDPSGHFNEFNPASAVYPRWFGEGWKNDELTKLITAGLQTADKRIDGDQRAKIAIQVWGEAVRDPELADLVAGIYRQIRARFTLIARRASDAGQLFGSPLGGPRGEARNTENVSTARTAAGITHQAAAPLPAMTAVMAKAKAITRAIRGSSPTTKS